jgi:hypothetical protein
MAWRDWIGSDWTDGIGWEEVLAGVVENRMENRDASVSVSVSVSVPVVRQVRQCALWNLFVWIAAGRRLRSVN